MAELCAAASQTLIRQHAMLPRKSLLEQMQVGSVPQLPMPPVRNLLAQSFWSDECWVSECAQNNTRGDGKGDGTERTAQVGSSGVLCAATEPARAKAKTTAGTFMMAAVFVGVQDRSIV